MHDGRKMQRAGQLGRLGEQGIVDDDGGAHGVLQGGGLNQRLSIVATSDRATAIRYGRMEGPFVASEEEIAGRNDGLNTY